MMKVENETNSLETYKQKFSEERQENVASRRGKNSAERHETAEFWTASSYYD